MSTESLATLRRYLLQALPEDEASALEARCFADAELEATIADVEHELIDSYLDGTLHGEERRLFEERYLVSPVHRSRVAAAKALRRASGRVVKAAWFSHPLVRLGVAAALIFALGALMRQLSGLQTPGSREARSQPADPVAPPAGRAPDAPPPPSTPPAPVSVFAVTLPAIVTRSAGPIAAEIPGTATRAQIRLEGDDAGVASLEADVRTVDNRIVWQGPASRGSSGILATIEVPADLLRPDDYIITVSSSSEPRTEVARYSVRIKRP